MSRRVLFVQETAITEGESIILHLRLHLLDLKHRHVHLSTRHKSRQVTSQRHSVQDIATCPNFLSLELWILSRVLSHRWLLQDTSTCPYLDRTKDHVPVARGFGLRPELPIYPTCSSPSLTASQDYVRVLMDDPSSAETLLSRMMND